MTISSWGFCRKTCFEASRDIYCFWESFLDRCSGANSLIPPEFHGFYGSHEGSFHCRHCNYLAVRFSLHLNIMPVPSAYPHSGQHIDLARAKSEAPINKFVIENKQ